MSDNILDQNDGNSLAALISAFGLSSIYDIYVVDSDHVMEDW